MEMRPNTSLTAGEQATVFSLKSSRSALRLPRGGWYSFMACTRARGTGRKAVSSSCIGFTSACDWTRAFAQACLNCFGVACQSFGLCEQNCLGAECAQALRRVLLHGDEFQEIIDAQSATETSGSARGQGVI